MRQALVVAVLLAAGLTGCLSAQDGDGPPSADPDPTGSNETLDEPRQLDVTLTDCDAIEAFAYVEREVARRHVPDDFDLLLGDDGDALVVLGGLRCGADAARAERGFVAIFVEPRDDALTADGVDNYFWEPEHHLAPGNDATDAFDELGADAHRIHRIDLTFSDAETVLAIDWLDGVHRATSSVPTVPAGGETAELIGQPFREYSRAQGGYTYLQAGFQANDAGPSGDHPMYVSTAPDTPARELIGEHAQLPAISYEGFTYSDATVGFVPRPS